MLQYCAVGFRPGADDDGQIAFRQQCLLDAEGDVGKERIAQPPEQDSNTAGFSVERRLGRNPYFFASARACSAGCGRTLGSWAKTLDTVAVDTPANSAKVLMFIIFFIGFHPECNCLHLLNIATEKRKASIIEKKIENLFINLISSKTVRRRYLIAHRTKSPPGVLPLCPSVGFRHFASCPFEPVLRLILRIGAVPPGNRLHIFRTVFFWILHFQSVYYPVASAAKYSQKEIVHG